MYSVQGDHAGSEGAGLEAGVPVHIARERAGEANICRSQMNIGGQDVVAVVGANTGQSGARVEGVSARPRIWVGSRVSDDLSGAEGQRMAVL